MGPPLCGGHASALFPCDFFETRTLTGARLYVFAAIEHSAQGIRIVGATAHPTAQWVAQLGRNLLTDLEDAGSKTRFLIRDRDATFTAALDAVLTDAGIRHLEVHRRDRLRRTLHEDQHAA